LLQFAVDYTGHSFKLGNIRDKEKHEVDFLVLKNNKPIEIIEARLGDHMPSPHLHYFAEKLGKAKAIQINAKPDFHFTRGKLRVTNNFDELRNLKRYID
jgi:hypothetical protein